MIFRKKSVYTLILNILIIIFFFQYKSLLYAEKNIAFSSIDVVLQYAVNTNENSFHDLWEHYLGLEGFIETPFYFGCVQAGVHLDSYFSKNDEMADFQTFCLYIGWGKNCSLPLETKIFAGINIGSTFMTLDKKKSQYEGQYDIEQELRTAFDCRLIFPLSENWNLYLSKSYSIIYTFHRIKLNYISAGISYSFIAPEWFREFIK